MAAAGCQLEARTNMTNLHNCQFKLHVCLLRYLNLIYNLQTPGENSFCFTFQTLRTHICLAAGCKTHEGRIKMCHLRHSIQSNRYIRAGCKFTAPRQMNSTVHSGRRGQAPLIASAFSFSFYRNCVSPSGTVFQPSASYGDLRWATL